MMENGLEDSEMVMVFSNGLMVLDTRDSGKIIELMARANLLILMATFMTVTGLMIKPTDMVSIIISMEPCTKDSGETIFNMEREKNHGQINQSMRVNIWQERSMVLVFTLGTMDLDTLVNGMKIKSRDSVPTVGLTVVNIKESGLIIIWMVWVYTHGPMEDATWENTRMTRSMDTVYTNGLMVDFTLVNG